jgi:hypothetical protein
VLQLIRNGTTLHSYEAEDPRLTVCGKPTQRMTPVGHQLLGALLSMYAKCQECDRAEMGPRFAFCETVVAGATSPIHIRLLTGRGMRTSGGCDTLALCGQVPGWDLPGTVDSESVKYERQCRGCRDRWSQTLLLL